MQRSISVTPSSPSMLASLPHPLTRCDVCVVCVVCVVCLNPNPNPHPHPRAPSPSPSPSSSSSSSPSPSVQVCFRRAEGFELVLKCLKDRRFAASCAPSALRHAISGHVHNCCALVEAGGLSYIMPLLMGKGLPKDGRGKVVGDKRGFNAALLAVLAQLCSLLALSTGAGTGTGAGANVDSALARLYSKLAESDYERPRKLASLFVKVSPHSP